MLRRAHVDIILLTSFWRNFHPPKKHVSCSRFTFKTSISTIHSFILRQSSMLTAHYMYVPKQAMMSLLIRMVGSALLIHLAITGKWSLLPVVTIRQYRFLPPYFTALRCFPYRPPYLPDRKYSTIPRHAFSAWPCLRRRKPFLAFPFRRCKLYYY